MKPYMVIEGQIQELEQFEQKVAEALELGYSLAGELIVQTHAEQLKLYQPMLLEETEDDIEDWEEEDEDEYED